MTGEYRGPAHHICNIKVTQRQSNSIPFVFHKFINYVSHLFFEELDDKKGDKVTYDNNRQTNEEYISVTNGFTGFSDSCGFS